MTGDRGRARIWPPERGEDAHHRGLAGAIRAEQSEHRAGLDGEIDTIEHGVAAEGLADPGSSNCVCHTRRDIEYAVTVKLRCIYPTCLARCRARRRGLFHQVFLLS